MTIASRIELRPSPGSRLRLVGRAGMTQISTQVRPGEAAVLLVEGAGGVFAWVTPDRPLPDAKRRARRTANFTVRGPRQGAPDGSRRARNAVLDWVAGAVAEPIKVLVLKFAVQKGLDLIESRIEGDKRIGIVAVNGPDPAVWAPAGGLDLKFKPQKSATILLLLHGTFATTSTTFDQLARTPSGHAFLSSAWSRYDAVIGFDHKTLAETASDNADDLMAAIDSLRLPKGSQIDAVCHSRGGLVFRHLAERLLPKRRPDIEIRKAVFVGCTNAGTHLADPKNWNALVDRYTNIVTAASRMLQLAGIGVAPIAAVGIKTIAELVKLLPEVAITDARVPGLASMCPGSADIKALDQLPSRGALKGKYQVIASNFMAHADPKRGIGAELALALADTVVDALLQGDNDLVVDTTSMADFGVHSKLLRTNGVYNLDGRTNVFHTVYFLDEDVVGKLCEFLDLPQPIHSAGGIDWAATRSVDPKGKPRKGTPSIVNSPPMPRLNGVTFRSIEPKDRPSRGTPSIRVLARRDRLVPPDASTSALARGGTARRPSEVPKARVAVAKPAIVNCFFAAEIDANPALAVDVPLSVTVSQEKIALVAHSGSAATRIATPVRAASPITIEVIAKRNSTVVGKAVKTVVPPKADQQIITRFSVRGVAAGEAEVLVEIRQESVSLAHFSLRPVFLSRAKTLKETARVTTELPVLQPAVMRIYELFQGGVTVLRFDLESREQGFNVSSETRLSRNFNRQKYVADLFDEIEQARSAEDDDRFIARLVAQGKRMARDLLPQRVQEVLWEYRTKIKAIQVISEEPFIRWELLYVQPPSFKGRTKGFLCEWGLVRWLSNAPFPGHALSLRKGRIVSLVPSYADPSLELVGAEEELVTLTRLFGQIEPLAANSKAVTKYLAAQGSQFDVLHFAGHGESMQSSVIEAALLLDGSKRPTGYIDDLLTIDMVKDGAKLRTEGSRQLVFLNACQAGRGGSGIIGLGGMVEAFLRPDSGRGAGAVVAAQWSVGDDVAVHFAEEFYRSLKVGLSLVDAAKAARAAAKAEGELSWLAYTVYGDPFANVV